MPWLYSQGPQNECTLLNNVMVLPKQTRLKNHLSTPLIVQVTIACAIVFSIWASSGSLLLFLHWRWVNRVELAIYGSFMIEFGKPSSESQTIESFINPWALNNLCLCEMMISWQHKECLKSHWLGTHKYRFHGRLPWCNLGFRSWASRSHSTWYPSRSHLSIEGLVKALKLSSCKIKCKVDLSEQACIRGPSPPMRRWIPSSSQTLSEDLLSEISFDPYDKEQCREHKENIQQLLHIKVKNIQTPNALDTHY